MRVARAGYRPLAEDDSLLLIILDDLRWANLRVVRVKPDIAKGTSLTQEVPALVQFDLDFLEPLTIGLGECPLLVQSVFLCDKVLNVIEDRLIFDLILHESLLSHGCDRNGQALMVRPPETAVNRCSDQHDDPGVGCQKKENVPGPISRRVAGLLSSSFLARFFSRALISLPRACLRQPPDSTPPFVLAIIPPL
jgi:hypothetical protein